MDIQPNQPAYANLDSNWNDQNFLATSNPSCENSTTNWQNHSITNQTGTFVAEFDASSSGNSSDGVIGFSNGPATAYTSLATIVRFNTNGTLDVRNGGTYSAVTTINYAANTVYHFKFTVNVSTHTYSVTVTPQGQSEQTLATNYAFRTEQNNVTQLNNLGFIANNGQTPAQTITICNLTTPTGTLTANAGNDKTIIPGGSTTLDGSASGGTIPYSYAWTPTIGLTNPNTATPTASPATTTTYTLTVTDSASPTPATATDTVTVTVQPPTASLSVAPTTGLNSSGNVGGPFTPNSIVYTLTNNGTASLNWTASKMQNWTTLSSTSGSLAVGANTTVTVSINSNANPLNAGNYSDTVSFTNTTNHNGDTTRTVSLTITNPGAGLTPIARWDTVPYQRISAGETLNLGVVAFSKNGINRVEFAISGQGYSSGTKTTTQMTRNPQSGVYEYWVPLPASEFSSDGAINVEATVYGNDSGIRNKDTEPGNGLDPLKLVVNPLGTLARVEAWVEEGYSGPSAVGDPNKPFSIIKDAITAIRTANGNRGDGAIIHLKAGNHTTHGSWPSDTLCDNEWLTITTAEGGTRQNTRLMAQDSVINVQKVRVKGITLDRSGGSGSILYNNGAFYDAYAPAIWIDDSDYIGWGAWPEYQNWWSGHSGAVSNTSYDKTYFTNDSITNVNFAVPQGTELARGLNIYDISDDAFQMVPLVVNCTADGLAGADDGPHADAWQWWGNGAKNAIVYGFRATGLHVQGIFSRVLNSDTASGVAFVNVYMELASDAIGNSWLYGKWDHLLMWHSTFVQENNGTYHDFWFNKEPTTGDLSITNASFIGNMFSRLRTAYPELVFTQTVEFNHSHYRWTNGEHTSTPGTDFTTGNPSLDAYGKPNAASPLLDRISPVLIPVDADNIPRDSHGDIGAYEYHP
jgi:hypothetical protein